MNAYLNDALWRLRANDSTLTELDLTYQNIDAKEAEALADALRSNTTLKELDLDHNNIGVVGAKALADALKSNTTLKGLNLSWNNIGDDGAKTIADALKSNTTLKEIYLNGDWIHNNGIGDDGAKALADALKSNSSITRLDLITDQIGVEGAKAFLNALTDRRSSAFLHLRNNFGNWSATVLADVLNFNTSLTCLYLKENNIGDELERQIRELLKRNGGNYSDSSEDDSSEGDY